MMTVTVNYTRNMANRRNRIYFVAALAAASQQTNSPCWSCTEAFISTPCYSPPRRQRQSPFVRYPECQPLAMEANSAQDDINTKNKVKDSKSKSINENKPRQPKRANKKNSMWLYNGNMKMYNHKLLTKEEETKLAQDIERGRALKTQLEAMLEEKQLMQCEWDNLNDNEMQEWRMLMGEDYTTQPENTSDENGRYFLQWLQCDGTRHSYVAKVSPTSPFYISPTSFGMLAHDVPIDDALETLITAHLARQELLSSNTKLVLSIAKKWHRSHRLPDHTLEEIIQEGMLGLVRAVDKYAVKRNTRLSTYATHWITSYVRNAVRKAKSVGLRLPPDLVQLSQKYYQLIRDHREMDVYTQPQPTLEQAAKILKVTPKRLNRALECVQPVLSLDSPWLGATNSLKGSAAGGDANGSHGLTLLDAIANDDADTAADPVEFVQLSLLRRALEQAMSSELSPYERDVIRLRLGLEDGHAKSVRQVVELSAPIMTMGDVRAAEQRAYRKLRDPYTLHAYQLHDFL